LKVVRFPEPPNPDGFVVLYLRPEGRFLFVGYWCGYERTQAAGQWSRQGAELQLKGAGDVSTDTIPDPEGEAFTHTFRVEDAHHTPSLMADRELRGWSLLSWKGPFMYVGQATIIAADGKWLPKSISEVDSWIERLVGR